MQDAMELRGAALRTQQSYIDAVVGLAMYYRRSPEGLGAEEVECYLLHLIQKRKLPWSTTNQAASAFNFLFRVTLKRPQDKFAIARRKTPVKQPKIVSRDEVERILSGGGSIRQRALLTATYAAGLRVSEVCALKIGDIDSERMMLRVNDGKGGRDRYTLLSPRLLEVLRTYCRCARPGEWLHPMRSGLRPIDPNQALRMYHAAKRDAGITNQGGIHALRHYAAFRTMPSNVVCRHGTVSGLVDGTRHSFVRPTGP